MSSPRWLRVAELVSLRYFAGLTNKQAALALGISADGRPRLLLRAGLAPVRTSGRSGVEPSERHRRAEEPRKTGCAFRAGGRHVRTERVGHEPGDEPCERTPALHQSHPATRPGRAVLLPGQDVRRRRGPAATGREPAGSPCRRERDPQGPAPIYVADRPSQTPLRRSLYHRAGSGSGTLKRIFHPLVKHLDN